jgi:hypothetical protein
MRIQFLRSLLGGGLRPSIQCTFKLWVVRPTMGSVFAFGIVAVLARARLRIPQITQGATTKLYWPSLKKSNS